jgi:DnaJ like chaperone protein
MSEHSKRIGEAAGLSLRRFSRVLGSLLGTRKPDPLEHKFVETLFLLFGHLARADGHVSQKEAELGEKLIVQLELDRHGRRLAVDQFERGKRGDFTLDQQLRSFNSVHPCGTQRSRELLDVLIELAKADGRLHPAERGLLEKIAIGLQVSAADLQRSLEHDGALPPVNPQTQLALQQAYAQLGVNASVSDDEVRQAYRRLISKSHPDKLSGQGSSDDALRIAQQRTTEVRAAYERVSAARHLR